MTDIKPYIIITSDATGSGKYSICQLIQKKYNLNKNNCFNILYHFSHINITPFFNCF